MFADLGSRHAFTYKTLAKAASNEIMEFKPMAEAFDSRNWALGNEKTTEGGSPFGGYRRALKARQFGPHLAVPVLGEPSI